MNILFINEDYFYYDRAIRNQFSRMGHQIDSYIYKKHPLIYEIYGASLLNKTPNMLALNRVQANMIRKIKKSNVAYDALLVTSGQELLPEILSYLRNEYPKTEFVWFLWDNICNIPQFEQLNVFYDKIVSFDKNEAEKYGFIALNDFYVSEPDYQVIEKIYDLSYVGTFNTERAHIISKIMENFPNINASINLFEYKAKGIRAFANRIIGAEKRKTPWSIYKKIDYPRYIDILKKSKCIVDISACNQTGLSMRPYEALKYRTKLITTNKSILNADFYNSQNILYVDPENVLIPDEFSLDSSYVDVPNEIMERYSIEHWCKEIERIIITR